MDLNFCHMDGSCGQKPRTGVDVNFNRMDHNPGTPHTGIRLPPMNLIPGGPFVPPTMYRMPVPGYSLPQHDYNRDQVMHMRHEAAESPECERSEDRKKKGRFF